LFEKFNPNPLLTANLARNRHRGASATAWVMHSTPRIDADMIDKAQTLCPTLPVY
jgi:hypothetical protein